MFETTVVESKKQKIGIQKYMTLPVSIALHVLVCALLWSWLRCVTGH